MRIRSVGGGFAAVTLILLGSLVAVAGVLSQAQTDSRDAAMRRFSERAQISAALTRSIFSALGSASGQDLQRRFGGSPASLSRALARRLPPSRARYLAVLDSRGEVLAASGRAPRRLSPVPPGRRGLVVSNVMTAGNARFIQYTIPFGPPNDRRALAQGVPVGIMKPFFNEYLGGLREVDGAGLALTDQNGRVITREGQIDLRGARPPGRVGTEAAVPGAPWVLRLEAERGRVLAGADKIRTLPWVILAALALAVLAGMGLYARLALASRRQRDANRALHESREQISNLVDALEEAVFLHHAGGQTELLNASAKEILGTKANAMERLEPGWEMVHADGATMEQDDTPIRRALASNAPCSQVVGLKNPGGSLRWLAVRARPLVRPGEDRPHAVVASCMDVTQQRQTELHLTNLALRDPLTGLWNRRRFEDDLTKQIARCRRYGERAALLVLDLDGFKRVNDTFGHLVGDEVLCGLADGLSRRLRTGDSAARVGGDEFAVLLVNVSREEAHTAAQEVAARLTEFVRDEFDAGLKLTLSVGVTVLDARVRDVHEAMAAADQEMYADKRRHGRSRPSGDDPVVVSAEDILNAASGSSDERFSSLWALLTAAQARDSYTTVHSRQVVTLARAVARRRGLDDAQVSEVETVALLHDLGKIAVPDSILRKREPLAKHEQLLVRQHPVVGAQMVSSIPALEHLGPAIRAEHERWDGTGYPDGLAGGTIPLSSRIAFVCDAYQAMISDRPYRRALSHDAAVAEIETESGRQFCPAVAHALLEVLRADTVHGPSMPGAGPAN